MREPDDQSSWSPVKVLLVTLITLFFIQCILQVWMNMRITQVFGLSLAGLKEGWFWQLITYQFLHAAPWPFHIIGNCIGIYFLGSAMHEVLGNKDFYKLFFGAGTLGGLLQILATFLPGHVDVPTVGASAGVFGLMGAFATMFPEKELTMWFYFLPLQIRAKHLFWGAFGLSLFGTLFPYSSVADAAHLGGLLSGFAFIRLGLHERSFFSVLRGKARNADPDPSSHTLYRERPRKKTVSAPSAQEESEDFISKEVDPILDKISQKGIHSLTEQERKILEKARSKMAKR